MVSKRMLARFGMTGSQRFVMRIVSLEEGISAGEVAARLHQHPSTLTGVLRRLVDAGWLLREIAPEDHRRTRLKATPAGKAAVTRCTGTTEEAVNRALAGMNDEEIAVLCKALDRLASELMQKN